ncbi:hypothetical protein ABH925_006419 [Streptacidiphilus sp. EB129]
MRPARSSGPGSREGPATDAPLGRAPESLPGPRSNGILMLLHPPRHQPPMTHLHHRRMLPPPRHVPVRPQPGLHQRHHRVRTPQRHRRIHLRHRRHPGTGAGLLRQVHPRQRGRVDRGDHPRELRQPRVPRQDISSAVRAQLGRALAGGPEQARQDGPRRRSAGAPGPCRGPGPPPAHGGITRPDGSAGHPGSLPPGAVSPPPGPRRPAHHPRRRRAPGHHPGPAGHPRRAGAGSWTWSWGRHWTCWRRRSGPGAKSAMPGRRSRWHRVPSAVGSGPACGEAGPERAVAGTHYDVVK